MVAKEYSKALYELAEIYAYCEDFSVAIIFLTKAANLGHLESQFELGYSYFKGRGVEENDETAVEWWTKSAKQGHAASQNALGVCYMNGYGVYRDLEVAEEWLRLAYEQGFDDSYNNLMQCIHMRVQRYIND